jgi:hypothetical protein
MTSIANLLKSAESLLNHGDLASAEGAVEEAIRKLKHKVTVEHDDGMDMNASSPSLDDADDGDDGDNGDASDDGSDDGDNGNGRKAKKRAMDFHKAYKHTLANYAASNTSLVNRNDEDNRPGDLSSSTHVSSDHARHKFEAHVERLQNEEGLPKSEAMSQARMRFPDVYRSYQRHTGDSKFGKSSASTFDRLVAAEMAKGVSEEIAKVRVVQLYGGEVLRDASSMTKGDDALYALEKRAAEIADYYGCEMTEALRQARQERPSLHKRLA